MLPYVHVAQRVPLLDVKLAGRFNYGKALLQGRRDPGHDAWIWCLSQASPKQATWVCVI